ncbi:zinc metalloproteinase nas-4-like [Hydractinia symbiolongicarpus]|uniref:zinc metalloproteinase nas-4-like n=1 Tax=Hydractinia symbiolongicarpus TaxID=13093 RepID=UPI00254B6E20|nr:zinc metalloproteinase nas-4-like [Hydractinia symbiolongicarpus]
MLLIYSLVTLIALGGAEVFNSTSGERKQYIIDQMKPAPPFPIPPQPLEIPDNEGLSAMDRIMMVNDHDGLLEPHRQAFPNGAPPPPEYFEGDIVKTPHLAEAVDEMKQISSHGLKAFDAINGGQWPNGEVPYTFAYNFRGRSVVYAAIAEFKKYTCIKFRPKTSRDRNYVQFMHGGGCSSMIGRTGGRQQISLASGCLVTGIAIHEMMHALGFFHEQSRRDRDNYITIYWNNISPAMRYNFQKYRAGRASTLGEPYDKSSVMHYGNYAFSINRRKTIVSRSRPDEVLGQRKGMSKIDIKQLNKYYKCEDTTGPTPPKGGKLTDKYQFCPDLKSWCKKDSFVEKNCEQSCCIDKNATCGFWTRQGYCKMHYVDYMRKTCPRSCGYC